MIRLLLLACLPILALAQTPASKGFAVGPAEFEANADGIFVTYHGHDWMAELSKLPIHAVDCQDAQARKECQAHPGSRCLACVGDWQPVAWDELNEIVYISASTGSKDKPMRIVFGYDLRSEQINRVVDGYHGGFEGTGAVSPSGRYVIAHDHEMCHSSHLVIIDTQTRSLRTIELPSAADNETARLTSVRSTGATTVEYSADIYRQSDCQAGAAKPLRAITGQLDVLTKLR